MAITTKKTPTTAWLAVATAGDVTLTAPVGSPCFWAITESTTAPTFAGGHVVQPGDNVSMVLTGTERLWVSSTCFVTAEVAVQS
jgi:hypothetical protein